MQFIHMKGIYIRLYRLSRVIIIAWLLYQVIFGGKYWIDSWFNPPYASAGNIDVFAKGQILICSNYDRLELYDMHLESWTRLGGAYEVLDKEIYAWEKDMDWFYQENKLYVEGSVGFYVIQPNPFHITLLINPNVDFSSPQYHYLSEALSKYNTKELTILYSETDLEETDRTIYERGPLYPASLNKISYPAPLTKKGIIDYRRLLLYFFA